MIRFYHLRKRDERTRRVADSITGFEVKGDLEPAHCVVDAYISMVEECYLKILPLSKCISRDQELNHAKVDKSIVTIENHQLQVRPKELEVFADLSTELRVQHAFTRRGLALEMANLMSYNVHEKITRSFMSYLTQSVPSAFQRPDISAVLRADRELWTRAADECRSNLKVNAHGKLPLDEAMLKLYQTAPVLFFFCLCRNLQNVQGRMNLTKGLLVVISRMMTSLPKTLRRSQVIVVQRFPRVCGATVESTSTRSVYVTIATWRMDVRIQLRKMANLMLAIVVFINVSNVMRLTP